MDSDGEFLLAEAAMHIPHWLTPENSNNRVFIYKSKLHIVPLAAVNSDGKGSDTEIISLSAALNAVVGDAIVTLASDAAEESAFERLKGYPEKLMQSMHRARCVMPAAIAKVLRQQPQLAAAAVELFYSSDSAQLKACGRKKAFPQETSLTTTVNFNRVQYAKLMSQGLPPLAGYNLPPVQSPESKATSLGMKLREPSELTDENEQQSQAKRHHARKMCFLTNVQGKPEMNMLNGLNKERNGQKKSSVESFVKNAAISLAEAITQTVDTCFESDANASDDDDSWLSLHPDELDALMRKADSVLKDVSQDDPSSQAMGIGEQDAERSLQGMLDSFESFLVADSGVEGVDLNRSASDGNDYFESSDEDVDLDASEIIDALMKVVGVGEMEQESKSEMSRDNNTDPSGSRGSDAKGKQNELDVSQDTEMHISLDAVMDAMDRELGESKVGQSFVQSTRHGNSSTSDNSEGHSMDDIPDVDVDLNLVENIVESFRAQEGLAGPAGTMLGQFGIHLPHMEDDKDDNGYKRTDSRK
ncbi:hypothetical protein IW140_000734 [Coemansia sp. RSA 1813]|nr:hypothetical protein IW140_000734 [Coemansia sp. RSA 1813]